MPRIKHVDHPATTPITHLSLCTGYGGIDLGLHAAFGGGLRTLAYAEIEASAIENLLARMEGGQLDAAPIWPDLRSFPWPSFHGKVDILTGGFPCQPFSNAGKRAGSEDERHLWPSIAHGITIVQPGIVFLENVEGLISTPTIEHRADIKDIFEKVDTAIDCAGSARGRYYLGSHRDRLYRRLLKEHGISSLLYVLCDMESRGYRATWGIFSASEVGAPHLRKRVFILAVAHDLGERGEELARRITVGSQLSAIGHNGTDGDAGIKSGGWRRVSYAGDCIGGDENEPGPECGVCGEYYPECECPGPDQEDEYEYAEFDGITYARTLADPEHLPGSAERRAQPGQRPIQGPPHLPMPWPSRPGEPQHPWEPPRIVDRSCGNAVADSECGGQQQQEGAE